MSKTLFNTNTFQSKNVRNSDDVGTLKVDTFKATNAILTNITNAELQAATSGVATNAGNISTNTTNISNNTSAISTNTTNISNNTTAIAGKQDALTTGDGIDITGTTISFDGTLSQDVTTSGFIRANSLEYLDGGVVTDVQTKIDGNATAISGKQDALTAGNGIDITGTTISFDGTSVTGDITTTGTITGNVMNYVNGGVVTNIQTEIDSKQDRLTQADNAGTGITISTSGVISATGGTYTAETNGGLALNTNNEFSIDFSNTNATINIPQDVEIDVNGVPQLIVKPSAASGQDGGIAIRGARTSSTSSRHAQLYFQNYDDNLSDTNNLGEIAGLVTNHTTNIGGLAFYSFADGNSRATSLTMNANGNFHFGTSFQDDYKLQVTGTTNFTSDNIIGGNSYIKKGLILDPFDMGTTTFTNFNDNAASATSREDIYIKFAPSSTTVNDWVYLRQIGTSNAGRLSFDFHDDTNDVRFSIRNVQSSGFATDVITEVFDVYSSGVTAHTAVYRIPQMVFYNFANNSTSGSTSGTNHFGDGGRFDAVSTTRQLGSAFCSISTGTVTFSQNGFYKIRVAANNQNLTYSDRTAFAVYLNINGTDYFQNRNYNFFGWTYTRNTSDGAHGNITFEDYIYISSSQTLQVRTKVDVNNRNFDDDLDTTQMICYCNLQIERIAETDIS